MEEEIRKIELQDEFATQIEEQLEQAEGEEPKKSSVKTRSQLIQERELERKERAKRNLETQKQLVNQSAIESVRRARTQLLGEILGTQPMQINGEEEPVICAVVKMEADRKTLMYVPYEEMYVRDFLDMSTVNTNTLNGRRRLNERKEQILMKLTGLKIWVMIKYIGEFGEGENTRKIIFASRADACKVIQNRAFRSKNPLVKIGEMYDATVISVADKSLGVTLYGVDTVIWLANLTLQFKPTLVGAYQPGDIIPVIVKDITNDENGYVKLRLDSKTPEKLEAQSRWDDIFIGARAHATITKVKPPRGEQPGVDISAWIEGYDMPCKISYINANDFGREPISGDSVKIEVKGFRRDGYIEAIITGLNGNGGYFNR